MAAPNFNGYDAKGWKQRCEKIFLVDETPNYRKVMYAAIKFEGRALHWHQLYAKISGKSLLDMSWDDYSRAMLLHFGEEPELEDELLQIQKAVSNLQLALARVEEDVSRLQKQSLMIQESFDEIEVELAECEEKSETEGIHSQTDSSSSLYYSVSFGNEIRMNFEVENSAHQVFDEMPDRNLVGIEVGFSDISLCRTILSNNSVGFVDQSEVDSKIEISVNKVFDEVLERSFANIVALLYDKSVMNDDDDRELDKGKDLDVNSVCSHLDFWVVKKKIGGLHQDVIVDDSSCVISESRIFNNMVCFVCDFWGQKSLKRGVLGITSMFMDIESFEWKPGWSSLVRACIYESNGADYLSMCLGSKDTTEMAIYEKCCWHMLSLLSIVIGLFEWKLELQYGLVGNFKKIQHKCNMKDWGYIVIGIESFGWKPGWLHCLVEKRNKAQHYMEGVFVSSFVMINLLKKFLMGESVEMELLAGWMLFHRLVFLIRLQPRNPHAAVLTISGHTNLCKMITWNTVLVEYVQMGKVNEVLGLFADMKDKELGSSSSSFYVSMLVVRLSSITATWARGGKQPAAVVSLTVLGAQSANIVAAVVVETCCNTIHTYYSSVS